jgi:hypothetical protein
LPWPSDSRRAPLHSDQHKIFAFSTFIEEVMSEHSNNNGAEKETTPDLESLSIYDALGRIGSQERPFYLPAIQRHFVWNMDQICELFDSILQGYPIGTFLFWEIEDRMRGHYAFYEFMRDYCERGEDRYNASAPRSLPPGVTGVLDGQQRLNSLYVALCGSYGGFIGGKGNHRHKLESYPRRTFFMDLLFKPDADAQSRFRFDFLTEWEANPEHWAPRSFWFPIHKIYHCTDAKAVKDVWNAHVEELKGLRPFPDSMSARAIQILELLQQRLRKEKLIRYFPIRNRNLTEALKIFIRANNGGTRVSEAEMIFSTIVAHWSEGRQKIEEFNQKVNQTGHHFEFDVSQIMLACLALSGCPIRLRIESFKPDHVDKIRDTWETITQTFQKAADLMNVWGLSGINKVNPNATIAVAILFHSGMNLENSLDDLRQFVLRSLIRELYRRPEGILGRIREYAEQFLSRGRRFNLEHFEANFSLASGKTIKMGVEQLDELLMLPIWDRRTYIVLSLLHPQHAHHQQEFHKDHIHPRARFEKLDKLGLSEEQIWHWLEMKDYLPNIQLLQGATNNEKRAKPFKDWLLGYRPNPKERAFFLDQNDIPPNCSLELRDFEKFFAMRKERLRTRLATLLNVKEALNPSQPETTEE